MIENGFTYLAVLMIIGSTIVYTEKKSQHKLFEYLPAIVIIYFVVMLASTFGLWEKTESVTAAYNSVKSNLLPAMIFLMLLLADMREIFKLGKKMILTFLLASTKDSHWIHRNVRPLSKLFWSKSLGSHLLHSQAHGWGELPTW